MFPPRSEAARYAALARRTLPRTGDASVRSALTVRLVERLEPITQEHTIEGLVMGEP